MTKSAPSRRDVGGLITLGLVALAVVPLIWHIAHRAQAAHSDDPALTAKLADTVPPGTTLVVGDPITEHVIKLNGWDKDLPFHIQWANLSGGPQVNQAFQAKALDIGSAADIPPIHATWIGIPVKIVAYRLRADPITYPTYTLGIAPGTNIATLADLKGKRIAYSAGQAQGVVVLRTLQAAHVRQQDVTLVDLPASATVYVEALAARQVDAAPIAAGLQAKRYVDDYGAQGGKVLSHGAFRDDPALLYARADVLADPAKAAALRQYVRLWARAQRWVDSHRQVWVNTYYVKDQGVTPQEGEVIARSAGSLDLPRQWDGIITLQQQTVDFLAAETHRKPFDAAILFDRRFEHVPEEPGAQ